MATIFRNPPLVRSIIVFTSVIMLVFLAISALNAWSAYGTDFDNAERRAETTVELLHQQVQATIETSALVLDAMVLHGQSDQIERNHIGITHDLHLMNMANHLPFAPWLVGIDAGDKVLYMENARGSGNAAAHVQPTSQNHQDHASPAPMHHGAHGNATSTPESVSPSAAGHHQQPKGSATNPHESSNASKMAHGSNMDSNPPMKTPDVAPELVHAFQAYLAMHRDQVGSNLMIGPAINKTSGDGWFFGVSRKMTLPDGTFAGVAIILLDAKFLEVLANSANLGDKSEMGLLGPGGAPLIWLNFDKGRANLVSSPNTHFAENQVDDPSGTIRVPGNNDGKAHIFSYRRLKPIGDLTAAVSIPEALVINGWLASRITDILFVMAFGISLSFLALPAFHLIVRPLRRIQESLNYVRDGNFEESLGTTTGVREINDVMAGVEEMRRSLKVLTEHLNSENATVAKRTDELVAANAELESNKHELINAKLVAEDASRAKSAFLANMSHELRRPLNAIIGYSEMMLEDAHAEKAEERTSDLEKVRNSGTHLLGLIENVLDISKIEAGKIELNVEPMDLTNVISQVENTAAPLMGVNNNQFIIVTLEDIGTIESDGQRLRQILLNLLSNAAKFTKNGEINLTVERDGDGWVRFSIRDTGIGMTSEQVERLFEPFGQADATIAQRFGGTGLGLSISHRFVEMMGGRITIESELGSGSCFTVWLPDIKQAGLPRADDIKIAQPTVMTA